MRVRVDTDFDMVQCSHIIAGLLDLEDRSEISVRFCLPARPSPKLSALHVVRVEVFDSSNERMKHVFDFHDHNSCFDSWALSWADVYWKANFNANALNEKEACLAYVPFKGTHD